MNHSDHPNPYQHQMLYQNDARTPLGRLRLAGMIAGGRGVEPVRPLRVYGSYAVMCIRRGAGVYRDANGLIRDLHAGDAVLVFPELAHWYGPRRGAFWDEFYITFDGPVFDAWRAAGLLDSARPLIRPGLTFTEEWGESVRRLLERRTIGERERARQVADFLTLMDALLRAEPGGANEDAAPAADLYGDADAWRIRACERLEINLERRLSLADVAAEMNLSYETFRKRFHEMTGSTPARYRMARRVEAAQALLRYTPGITNREIAETLGFADEFHFSRRFTQVTGSTPRQYRRALAARDDGGDG